MFRQPSNGPVVSFPSLLLMACLLAGLFALEGCVQGSLPPLDAGSEAGSGSDETGGSGTVDTGRPVDPVDTGAIDRKDTGSPSGDTSTGPVDTGAGRDDSGGGCVDGSTMVCGKAEGICKQGTRTCQNGQWGSCEGSRGPRTEICDGKDNDCNGQVDDGLSSCACVSGETQSCGKSTGQCKEGTRTCQNGSWSACMGDVGPQPEVCDGKDNDCNGRVDEIGCSCTNGMTRPCGNGTGDCRKGTQTCKSGQWGPCLGQVGPKKETCDGRDNNCDGRTDENLSRSCGSDTGQCQAGTQVCSGGRWGSCMGRVDKSPETCDGKDNDCDGRTDEGLTKSCGTDTGQCQSGMRTCSGGSYGSCQGDVGPSKETCDGKDNDCNGKIDDGLFRSCGSDTGVCQKGTEYCSAGSWGSCKMSVGPSKETCDGKDNDCNGKVDDLREVLMSEDFEGPDPLGWQEWTDKGAGNHKFLEIDDDVTGNAHQGSEYAEAYYKHGSCRKAAGIGEDFKVNKDIDIIIVYVKVDIASYGTASIFLEDSNGNRTKLWEVKGKGDAYSTGGWRRLRFNETIQFKRTLPGKSTTIEQNPVPLGVGNEELTLIFGNGDDSLFCRNSDHKWKMRVDDIRVIGECG